MQAAGKSLIPYLTPKECVAISQHFRRLFGRNVPQSFRQLTFCENSANFSA